MSQRLLLLHGFLSGRAAWMPVARLLAPEVSVAVPDLLDYGSAPRPARRARYSLEAILDALEPVLRREEPTHVAGHSMGAIVALGLAARHRGRFDGIGLVGLPLYAARADGLDHLHRRGRLMQALLGHDGVSHVGCAAAHASRRLWLPLAQRRFPGQPREVLLTTFDHGRAGHGGALDNVVFAGLVPALSEGVDSRVSLLHGANDRAAPAGRAEALARERGWPIEVVAGANHQVIVERPELAASWIRERVFGREEWVGRGA